MEFNAHGVIVRRPWEGFLDIGGDFPIHIEPESVVISDERIDFAVIRLDHFPGEIGAVGSGELD